jgi:hypothetical protein
LNFAIISTLARHLHTPSRQMSSTREQDITHLLSRQRCSDDMPVAVYEGLIQSVRGNLKPLFRYFDLRRRALVARVASA